MRRSVWQASVPSPVGASDGDVGPLAHYIAIARLSECVLTRSCILSGMAKQEHRASPLTRVDRREAIVTAVLPLVAARGTAVTSRELSETAGVAEGTIFKAFADKDDLFRAVLDRVTDPEPTERGIRSIDPALAFEQRLEVAAELMQRRLVDVWNILSKIGAVGMPVERRTIGSLTRWRVGFADTPRLGPSSSRRPTANRSKPSPCRRLAA